MDKMGRIVKLKLTPLYPSPAGEGKKGVLAKVCGYWK